MTRKQVSWEEYLDSCKQANRQLQEAKELLRKDPAAGRLLVVDGRWTLVRSR